MNLKDVAKYAGVSVGTVSNVINNLSTVKPKTREAVQQAIKELGYVPNEIARNFKMQKSTLCALLVPSIHNSFYSELAYYIEDELSLKGYKLIICNSANHPEKELEYLNMLSQNKVAGILGVSYNDTFTQVDDDIPIVGIDSHLTHDSICVTSDNWNGGAIACTKLIEAGVGKPAFFGTVTADDSEISRRKFGFEETALKHGLEPVIWEVPDDRKDDPLLFDEFFSSNPDVDGVFCITDITAAILIKEAEKMGKKVPADLKVIGFDGIQENDLFHPVLATIRQPVEGMARESVRRLINKIRGHLVEETIFRIPVSYRSGETV